MLAIKISIIYSVVAAGICQQVVTDDERPFLRILAPKFICNDKNKGAAPNNNLTIALQTREGQKLRYKISVDFEMLDGFKSQKHTLSIWKNIRILQKKFANISDDISLKNQIEINAQELTPQVIYTFKITGYDENNLASETQNFTITFKGGELKAQHSNLGDGVSLLLFSSEFFYDDMELLAVAEVSFCDPIQDFSFRWKVVGHDMSEIEKISGNSLKLASGFLTPGKLVELSVAVLNNESLTMASATLPVKILAKEFQLQIAPSDCLVGTGREVPFQALISREFGTASISTKWYCSKDDVDCSKSSIKPNLLTHQVSFPENGNYEIKSEVSINEVTKSATSKVAVDAKVIPNVQLMFFPSQPINVMRSTEIVVTVLNLIPKCVAYWNIRHEDGFARFRNGSEGNYTNMGLTFIKDFEQYFLQELIDYDNNTLSKDVTLSIPAEALLPNEKYKFRLTTTCPEPLIDSKSQTQIANVTSFYDIVFDTNAPPKMLPVFVTPLSGIPMKQKFKFSTVQAKALSTDFPLKYTFGYVVNNLTITIGSFYENTVAYTQLPFADRIETFCEACDNNGACARKHGPVITANKNSVYTSDEVDFKLEEFGARMRRAEYSDSLNTAVVLLLTQRKASGGQISVYEARMTSMMKAELEKLKSTDSSGVVYQQNVIEFVKMAKVVINVMQLYDETLVDDLLSLTETISRSAKRMKRMAFANNSYAKVVSHDTDYIKNVLGFSEMLLNSKNATIVQREKGKFVSKLHQFIGSMCQDKNLNSQFIETQFASFEVSKVFSPQLFMEAQKFPGGSESTVLYNYNVNFSSKYICVARVRFTIDMFKVSTDEPLEPVYEIRILDDDHGTFKAIKSNEFSDGVMVDISVSTDASAMTCMLWKNENWLSEECSKLKTNSTGRIACKCKTSAEDGVIIKAGRTHAGVLIGTTVSHPQSTTDKKEGSTTPFTFLSTPTTMRTTQTPLSTEPPRTIVATESTNRSDPVILPTTTVPVTQEIGPSDRTVTKITTLTTIAPLATITSENIATYNISSENMNNVNEYSSINWIVMGLLLAFFAMIMVLFSVHKYKNYASTHMNLPMRNPSNGIKYARYHDEFTMQG